MNQKQFLVMISIMSTLHSSEQKKTVQQDLLRLAMVASSADKPSPLNQSVQKPDPLNLQPCTCLKCSDSKKYGPPPMATNDKENNT